MRAANTRRWQRALTGLLFLSPLLLCSLGHDVSRWIGAMCLDATLFLLYLYLTDGTERPVQRYLTQWAERPAAIAWLAYLIAIGPFGATGILTAERFYNAWNGY